jgi:hypothetical protein
MKPGGVESASKERIENSSRKYKKCAKVADTGDSSTEVAVSYKTSRDQQAKNRSSRPFHLSPSV